MISVSVEKEIKQENRIIGNFTARQIICFGAMAFIAMVVYFIASPPIRKMIPLCLILGVIAWLFGFYKKNGLYIEFFLIKTLKTYIFRNMNRKYRTKNKYITLLNSAYNEDKMADMQDKRKKKIYEKTQKRAKNKRSKLHAYK